MKELFAKCIPFDNKLEQENNTEMRNYHDKWIELLFEEYAKCSKEKAVNGFLSSFGTGNHALRSGLPVFAIMQTFPKHSFQLRKEQTLNIGSPCNICSSFYGMPDEIKDFVKKYADEGRWVANLIDYYYAYLKIFNEIKEIPYPNEKSFQIFSEILEIILSANPDDTLKKDVLKKIGKINGLKTLADQRQLILETLGYCGILETEKHKGAFHNFTNLSTAPRKTHSSDWHYPADFWLGKDGINKEAFRFWFGEFSELKRYFEMSEPRFSQD
jgi:hypothetical protein